LEALTNEVDGLWQKLGRGRLFLKSSKELGQRLVCVLFDSLVFLTIGISKVLQSFSQRIKGAERVPHRFLLLDITQQRVSTVYTERDS
jgi:hypothetical protein